MVERVVGRFGVEFLVKRGPIKASGLGWRVWRKGTIKGFLALDFGFGALWRGGP